MQLKPLIYKNLHIIFIISEQTSGIIIIGRHVPIINQKSRSIIFHPHHPPPPPPPPPPPTCPEEGETQCLRELSSYLMR